MLEKIADSSLVYSPMIASRHFSSDSALDLHSQEGYQCASVPHRDATSLTETQISPKDQ